MKHNQKLEQRTFLQDRFEILIKRQKAGKATFNELTELDEIVNRNAAIREKILEEMQEFNGPASGPQQEDVFSLPKKPFRSLWSLVKSFISRFYFKNISTYGKAYNLSFCV